MMISTSLAFGGEAGSRGGVEFQVEADRGEVHIKFLDAASAVRDTLVLPALLVDGVVQTRWHQVAPDEKSSNIETAFANDTVRIELERVSTSAVAVRWIALDGAAHDFVAGVRDSSWYYGTGERFNSLNHKGEILPIASIDHPGSKGGVTYKPIPYYMSTRGYALWVDNAETATFDFNATTRDLVLLNYHCRVLRVVLINGPGFAAMLDEFTRLTGRPKVPPMWSFAPWKSRDVHRNREELLADAELTRKHDLPGSVIVIDSPWETGYNDFTLNEQQFADPQALFARIRALGFYPCFWLTPFINSENRIDMTGIVEGASPNFAEARDRGFLVKRPNGEPMITDWWKGRGGLVDFTNPDAVTWWHDQIDKTRPWGLHAIKCDDGEGNFVADAVFHDGSTADVMKNRYAALYLQAAQGYIDERLDGDGVLFARSGFTGAQQYPFGWAGDNAADFSFDNGFPGAILAAQNAALSGMPMWASDIAGYMGTPTKELFIRWTQFGALSPLMQVHMTCNLGPWDFDDETLAIYHTFAKLHTSLAPYLMNAAQEAAATGMPIIRPMVLAFPNDHDAVRCQFQYLLGHDLLVAPMYQSGTQRSVYLPKTDDDAMWFDYWSGQRFPGGQRIAVDAPLARVPLFVRGGALLYRFPEDLDTLIPRHEDMDASVVAVDDRRVLQVWPACTRKLVTFDGVSATVERDGTTATLTLTSASPRRMDVQLIGAGPDAMQARSGWQWDGKSPVHREVAVDSTPITLTWPVVWQSNALR
ncbi:MAG: glycoside hydrolase family 31 protein [Phycisphaerales bacterium]|nr:glycoside hydrolase family 31 protein [Phycisphaerales bacterium]